MRTYIIHIDLRKSMFYNWFANEIQFNVTTFLLLRLSFFQMPGLLNKMPLGKCIVKLKQFQFAGLFDIYICCVCGMYWNSRFFFLSVFHYSFWCLFQQQQKGCSQFINRCNDQLIVVDIYTHYTYNLLRNYFTCVARELFN